LLTVEQVNREEKVLRKSGGLTGPPGSVDIAKETDKIIEVADKKLKILHQNSPVQSSRSIYRN
jgi:hypothetical protein